MFSSLASVKPANLSTDNVSPVAAIQESLVTLLMPTVRY